jgi:hypothetical protein
MDQRVLIQSLRNGGIASSGSNTTLTDNSVSWIVNDPLIVGAKVKILHAGIEYSTLVVSNTATQLTFNALPGGVNVVAGDAYFFSLDQASVSLLLKIPTFGVVSTAGSPFSLPNDVAEHTVLAFTAAQQLVNVELDLSNLTQINTIREYVQVDATNYRQLSAKTYPTNYDPGTYAAILDYVQKGVLYQITMQAAVAEGAIRAVPYRYYTRGI